MVRSLGSYNLTLIHQVRAETQREGLKVSRDVNQLENQRQREAFDQKSTLRTEQLTESLKAAEIKKNSFLGGFLPVAGTALGSALGMLGQALVSPALRLPVPDFVFNPISTAVGGVVSGILVGKLTGAIGGVVALHHENKASRAEVGVLDCDMRVARGDAEKEAAKDGLDEGRKEGARTRKAIERDHAEAGAAREHILSQIGDQSRSSMSCISSGKMAKATASLTETAVQEELDADRRSREAKRDAMSLRLDALETKKKATEEEIAHRERTAWLTLGREIIEIASTFASCGASAVATGAVKIASVGVSAVQYGMASETEGQVLRQRVREQDLERKERERDGAEADADKRAARKMFDRSLAAGERVLDSAKYGGDRIMMTSSMNLAGLAKARAGLALEESKDSRHEISEARRDALKADQEALKAEKASDEAAGHKEQMQAAFSLAGSLLSAVGGGAQWIFPKEAVTGATEVSNVATFMGNEADGLSDIAKLTQDVCDVGSSLVNAGGAVADFAVGDPSRPAKRAAAEASLRSKTEENRISDARSNRDAAEATAQRALDAAITMYKNLTPVLA